MPNRERRHWRYFAHSTIAACGGSVTRWALNPEAVDCGNCRRTSIVQAALTNGTPALDG